MLLALVVSAGAAGAAHAIGIEEPLPGSFHETSPIDVSGSIETSDPASTTASLNGQALLLSDGGPSGGGASLALFEDLVALDFDAVFNSLLLSWELPDATTGRDRVTVVAGDSTADGDASLESSALRFTDSGLAAFVPALEGLVQFDLTQLLPFGSRIYKNCLIDLGFECAARARVYIDNPPPSFDTQRVELDSFTDGVQLDLHLTAVSVYLAINGDGLVPDCRLRLTADEASISARHALQPDPQEATHLDLVQVGGVGVGFTRFRQDFFDGACDNDLIRDVLDAIVGNLENSIRDELRSLLQDPDGSGPGDGPLADAIEEALADVEITKPIGEALEVGLQSPLAFATTDDGGLTLVTDTIVQARIAGGGGAGDPEPGTCDAPFGAPDLEASYEPLAELPPLGETTPVGGFPFDVALVVDDAALGQGLKALTECGLLHSDLEELELGGNPFPVTALLLSGIEPAFASLPSTRPLTIRVRPTLAPILTAGPGPDGELAALRIAGLRIEVYDPTEDRVWLGLAVDATAGLEVGFGPGPGELEIGTGEGLAEISIVVLDNAIGAEEGPLRASLIALLEGGALSLSDELGSFAVPGFLGLELNPVEVARDPTAVSFFFEVVPEPSGSLLAAVATVALAGVARARRSARRSSG